MATTHWRGQAIGDGLAETDDPREVDCGACRTMMFIGGAGVLDVEPRPKSMADAYAALRARERNVLARWRRRRVKGARRRS